MKNYLSGETFGSLKTLFKRMKATFLMLIMFCSSLYAINAKSQIAKVNISLKNASVLEVLETIEKQTNYLFVYNKKEVDLERKVNINVLNRSIDYVLSDILKDSGISYKKLGTNIVLIPKQQQKINVSGKITDTSGSPLPGVTVLVKGTNNGTVSNAEGKYSLSNIPNDATLQFSFVGMESQEIAIGGKGTIDVVMTEDAIGIEEVVAIGYGTARRKDIAGSVSSINMEDSPVAITSNFNILSSLKGLTPGLNIGTVNSAGDEPDYLIRGQNSINGSNDPLIVLDGVLYLGSLNDINANDVASYDILKDASATAIYGSRAANGVIIITSKKGRTQKPTIQLNTSTGINAWQQKPDIMDPYQNLEVRMDPYDIDDPLDIPELKYPEVLNYQDGKTVDWLKEGSRIGINQNYQLSVSGQGTGMNYYLSTGYLKQEGVIIGDDYKQISIRGKINTDITSWLEIGADGIYNFRDYSGEQANVENLLSLSPWGDLYVRGMEGNVLERYPVGESIQNPLWKTDKNRLEDLDHINYYRLSGFVKIDVPFIKGLSYRLNYVRGNQVSRHDVFYHENYYVDEGYGTTEPEDRCGEGALKEKLSAANGYIQHTNDYNYVVDNIINYKKEIDKHYIDATLVATRDYSYNKVTQMTGSDFEANGNTALGTDGLHYASIQSYDIDVIEEANIGYMARLSYSYSDKYHLTASFRRDGSSVFGTDKKWGNFPSLGLAWTTSEEDFFSSIDFFNYLKIRASYGKNGNQGIDAYKTLTTISSGKGSDYMYEFSDDASSVLYGLNVSSLGNSYLGWETTSSFNFGIESVMYNNRVSLNLDVYFSKTTDQLFEREIPIMTGFSSIYSSMGQVNNSGIELRLTTKNIEHKNFAWNTSFTFWQNKNVLKKLYGDDDGDGIEDDDIGNSLFVGKSLGAIYGYKFDGIVQEDDTDYMNMTSAEAGDVKFKDISGPDGKPDGEISSDYDRTILGYSKERFRLNLANTFNYKNFELYFLLSGIFGGGNDNYFVKSNSYAFVTITTGAKNSMDIPWWTAENKSNKYPKPKGNTSNWQALQSRNFARIQDVTLSYQFDNSWLKKCDIQALKLYTSIQNLYTFTNWVGGDPEEGVTALSSTNPVPTVYTVGLNISF